MPWIASAAALILFVYIEFYIAKKAIFPLYNALEAAQKKAYISRGILAGSMGDAEKAKRAKEMYEMDCKIYSLAASAFNKKVTSPLFAVQAWFLGFKVKSETISIE